MITADFALLSSGAFWSGVALPAALLVLSLFGGFVVAQGLRRAEATRQILGAFFAVAGLYLAEGQTALPFWASMLALGCGLLTGLERVPARAPRRVKRPSL